MGQILVLFFVFCFLLLGLVGAILPIIPGPIMSYLAILLIHFFTELEFSFWQLFLYTVFTVLVFFSDHLLQFLGVKKLGGQKYALYGTAVGILAGLFFTPIGLFLGAFLGALMDSKNKIQATRIAFGALLGFIFGTVLKLVYAVYIIFIILEKIDLCLMFNYSCP